MEWLEAPVGLLFAKLLKRGRLRRCGKGQIGRVTAHFAGLHRRQDSVLRVILVQVGVPGTHRAVHGVMGLAALTAVRLVDDHSESFFA
ncbi:hypothetical protein D3C84_866660 [compost metagenome]